MPNILASDSIAINNIPSGYQCMIISSERNREEGIELTCKVFDQQEVDSNGTMFIYEWYYFTNNNTWARLSSNSNSPYYYLLKSVNLDSDFFSQHNQNSIKICCRVYSRFSSHSDLELNNDLIGYDEIVLDMTVKKWMRFDSETGLWIYGNDSTSDWATLNSNDGFHIYHIVDGIDTKYASFAEVTKIQELQISTLTVEQTATGGINFVRKQIEEVLDEYEISSSDWIIERQEKYEREELNREYFNIQLYTIEGSEIIKYDQTEITDENINMYFKVTLNANLNGYSITNVRISDIQCSSSEEAAWYANGLISINTATTIDQDISSAIQANFIRFENFSNYYGDDGFLCLKNGNNIITFNDLSTGMPGGYLNGSYCFFKIIITYEIHGTQYIKAIILPYKIFILPVDDEDDTPIDTDEGGGYL